MDRWLSSVRHSQLGIYLQFLIPLVLLTALIFGLMSITGCGGCGTTSSPDTRLSKAPTAAYQCRIKNIDGTITAGEQTKRMLYVDDVGASGSGVVSYAYTPPQGADRFEWDADHPPENPDGPPPYIFRDVPAVGYVMVSFHNPTPPADQWSAPFTEVLVADHHDGTQSEAAMNTVIQRAPTAQSAAAAVAGTSAGAAAPAARIQPPSPKDDLWQVGRYVDALGITLTTALCDEWLPVLQSDEVFLAARVPIVAPVLPTDSYTLPLAYRGSTTPTISLVDYTNFGKSLFKLPVELRPDRFTFANNELPAAPGEAYLVLGVSQDPATCPAGIDLPVNSWGLTVTAWLDLQAQPDNCAGCELPFYYCYEGQELPAPLSGLAGTLASAFGVLPEATGYEGGVLEAAGYEGGVLEAAGYEGEGITCLGPHYVSLEDGPEWELGGSSTTWFSPTVPISFHHYILNFTGSRVEPMTFDLEWDAPLGDVWHVYEGDWDGPTYPLVEITPPVLVDGGSKQLWFLAEPATPPAAGQYTLVVTATRQGVPGEVAVASDLFWVGDWVAPPPPQTTGYHSYLPLILRDS